MKILKPGDIQERFPSEFAKFYPRRFTSVGGYTSPKLPAATFTVCELNLEHDFKIYGEPHDSVGLNTALVGRDLVQLRMPIYWIGRELSAAMENTSPPDTLVPEQVNLPLDAMLFILPEKSLVFNGRDCSWIGFSVGMTDRGRKAFRFVTSNLYETFCSVLPFGEPLSQLESREANAFSSLTPDVVPCNDLDRRFIEKLTRIGVNLLMVRSARPSLVEEPTPCSMPYPAPDAKAADKFHAPNWIGRTYQAVRHGGGGGKTHASPELHWRRGHWRHQAHGPRLTMRKDIWIEPTLVGAEQ